MALTPAGSMSKSSIIRVAVTLGVFLTSIALAHALWRNYMYSPWMRDGRVRAKVVNIAPDVSGLVASVLVNDNQQVHHGDVLFIIDPARFQAAMAQAVADVARAQAEIVLARAQVAQRESERTMRRTQAARRAKLAEEVVSMEARTDYSSLAQQADASLAGAQATLKAAEAGLQAALATQRTAQINLDRSVVRAPADGAITNLELYSGDYATAGVPRLALIESHSFWIYGYFEETKLPEVRIGNQVRIHLLSGRATLRGHVEGIASGITDRDNPTGGNLLADVNPVFTWIRLAQRVPVRIAIDEIPPDTQIAAGMTCTVSVEPARHGGS